MSALPLPSPHVLVSSAARAQHPLVGAEVFARLEAALAHRMAGLPLTDDGEGFIAAGDFVGLYVVSGRERQVTLLEVTRRLPAVAARPVLVR